MRLTDTSHRGVSGPDVSASGSIPARRRRLRAVLAADVANYGGLVSVDETNTLDALWLTRRVATEELATHGGWLFGLPGDGIFALFESTVDAVRCALCIQARLTEAPKLYALKLRIGVHLGEVLFQDEIPCGEALVIAARLESLAEPGGILVSASVMDAIASHIAATFVACGVPTLKHSPRRIETFRVLRLPQASESGPACGALDRTFALEPIRPQAPEPEPGPVEASAVAVSAEARLPKASDFCPLLKAAAKDEAAVVARSPKTEPPLLDEASVSRLTLVLAKHLGPVAKVLVRRKVAECREREQLILKLAQEIPSEGERLAFVMRAKAALSGPH